MLPWYVGREAFKRAGDVKGAARDNVQVDRVLAAATRDVEGDLGRRFYPRTATYTFPAPNGRQLYPATELDVDLVAVSSITVGGTVVDSANYALAPVDGPPYEWVEFVSEIRQGTTLRPVAIAGTWGYDDRTEPAGTLAAALSDTTGTTVDLTATGADVGDLLTVGTEKLVVTERGMIDSGQDMIGSLSKSQADKGITVADGSLFAQGEIIQVDNEQLLIESIAGNLLTVKRAFNGSILDTHSAADIYAARRLTVERGVLGSTAATHTLGIAVSRQVYDGLLVAYTAALAQYLLMQEIAGQAGKVPSSGGTGTVLDSTRAAARQALQRL